MVISILVVLALAVGVLTGSLLESKFNYVNVGKDEAVQAYGDAIKVWSGVHTRLNRLEDAAEAKKAALLADASKAAADIKS